MRANPGHEVGEATKRKLLRPSLSAPYSAAAVGWIAGWSSLVARQAHNLKVVSSNLTPATNRLKRQRGGNGFFILTGLFRSSGS